MGQAGEQMLGKPMWQQMMQYDGKSTSAGANQVESVVADMLKNPVAKFTLDRGMLVHGVPTPVDYFQVMSAYSLKERDKEIECPVFLSEAENDRRRGGGPLLAADLNVPHRYVLFQARGRRRRAL